MNVKKKITWADVFSGGGGVTIGAMMASQRIAGL